ncbi:hypothetical protein NDU88_004743 [Pleurodeles waltl]|uniref:Uncharacterized protein n=1 Tax=Pleurodeles waltl TaxID=8319 RepID=A0AAV7LJ29_PLEWA|nr:hypothetical protein NDU88_004743 [Pleurodeles waltl]
MSNSRHGMVFQRRRSLRSKYAQQKPATHDVGNKVAIVITAAAGRTFSENLVRKCALGTITECLSGGAILLPLREAPLRLVQTSGRAMMQRSAARLDPDPCFGCCLHFWVLSRAARFQGAVRLAMTHTAL